jgi:hypothetical protein
MPQFQQDFLQNTLLPFATNISEQQFTPYTGQMTASVPTTAQNAAQYYDVAGNIATMTPQQYAAMTQANYNPYQTDVIDAAVARMNREREVARVGEQAELAKRGAFGNERRGVYEAERQAAYGLGRDQMIADLMRQGYSEAQAATMAQIGQSQSAAQQAAAGYTQLGGLEQATEQSRLDALYQEFLREQGMPYQQLSALTGAASGIPTMTSTTTQNRPGLFDYLTAGATAYGAYQGSDRRLKKNIQHIDTIDGVKFYTWEWNEIADQIGVSGDRNVGVIAQELEAIHPELVVEGSDGYLRVNYGGLAAKLQEAA